MHAVAIHDLTKANPLRAVLFIPQVKEITLRLEWNRAIQPELILA